MKSAAPAKNPPPLDDTDLEILTVLVDEGRLTNAAIAHRVGIAESTCANRIRALRDQGVIEGFRAHLNLAALGRPIEAIVKVRLSSHNRDNVMSFHESLARMPGVLAAFHVAGEDDYLLHVAVPTPAGAARPGARPHHGEPRRPAHRDPAGLRGGARAGSPPRRGLNGPVARGNGTPGDRACGLRAR